MLPRFTRQFVYGDDDAEGQETRVDGSLKIVLTVIPGLPESSSSSSVYSSVFYKGANLFIPASSTVQKRAPRKVYVQCKG